MDLSGAMALLIVRQRWQQQALLWCEGLDAEALQVAEKVLNHLTVQVKKR